MQRCVLLLLLVASTDAFTVGPRSTASLVRNSSLQMAGFGAAPKKDKKKMDIKLKPKQQWDRYVDLKGSEIVTVAVRVLDAEKSPADAKTEWYQVGTVKSKDNAYTEAAIMKQRLLIAEHSRRLYPAKILPKDQLEWAYLKEDKVIVAGKVELWTLPDDIEKIIGFLGLPEASGFYMKPGEGLVDNTAQGFATMKKMGKAGFD